MEIGRTYLVSYENAGKTWHKRLVFKKRDGNMLVFFNNAHDQTEILNEATISRMIDITEEATK